MMAEMAEMAENSSVGATEVDSSGDLDVTNEEEAEANPAEDTQVVGGAAATECDVGEGLDAVDEGNHHCPVTVASP